MTFADTIRLPSLGNPAADALAGLLAVVLLVVFLLCLDFGESRRAKRRRG
jgi:hypothetical protein